jgi:hypothetical protein
MIILAIITSCGQDQPNPKMGPSEGYSLIAPSYPLRAFPSFPQTNQKQDELCLEILSLLSDSGEIHIPVDYPPGGPSLEILHQWGFMWDVEVCA